MNNYNNKNEEIDLKNLWGILLRRKIFLIVGLIGGITLAIFKTLNDDKIYQGNFIIDTKAVVTNSLTNTNLPSNLNINRNIIGKQEIANTLYVIQSPYVLKDVFKFYKEIADQNDPAIKVLDINKWISDSIFIENIYQTTVLKVSYRDKNKKLISPVLNKILDAYQNYSIEGNTKVLDASISYIKREIEQAEIKTNQSLEKAQTFALNNSLMISEGLPSYSSVLNANAKTIESKLLELKREANLLEQQIKDARNADDVLFLTKLVPNDKNPFFSTYTEIKNDLADKRITFFDEEPSIQYLLKKEKKIIKEINNYTISQLESLLKISKKQLDYLNKPNDILQKHRILIQKALNEQFFLKSLKDGLLSLQLQRAEKNTPWKILNNPQVGESPYSPRLKEELIIFGPLGIILGVIFALIYESKKKLIYDEEILIDLIPYKLLETFSINESDEWNESINLIAQGPLLEYLDGSIGLLTVGKIDISLLKEFEDKISKTLDDKKKILSSSDLLITKKCSTQILLVQSGMNTNENIKNFLKKLTLQNANVSGWILFKNKNQK